LDIGPTKSDAHFRSTVISADFLVISDIVTTPQHMV